MKVSVQCALNDANLDANQARSQRQIAVSVAAVPDLSAARAAINLCLILDRSGSMSGRPLETVKAAAQQLVAQLSPDDRLAIVTFDHRAEVLLENQRVGDAPDGIARALQHLNSRGGTAIDEGMKLGIEELAKGRKDAISQAFLLTDGENEHGDNERCLKLAELAASYTITLNCLGFGSHWNQDVLEQISDAGSGTLTYIERPDDAAAEFDRLLTRVQSVRLTNAHLLLELEPQVRLADHKPLAQVAPETIELAAHSLVEGQYEARLGDLMTEEQRVVLANCYVDRLPEGRQTLAKVQVRYDDPALGQTDLLSEAIPVEATVQGQFESAPDAKVQTHVYALAKYRQTQIAETKLQQGDRQGAATMLQTAAKTALQMGDSGAATVLQTSATQLQQGEELSERDRKKTRIASKTVLQPSPE